MKSLEIIKSLEGEMRLEKGRRLSPIEKILAVTNGSVTQILEIITSGPVRINTVSQEVKEAGGIAKSLGVSEADEVNFREVEITDQEGNILVNAKSWTPLKRLEPGFKEDLMKADVPIGKLLIKHRIEARRELVDAWVEEGKVKRVYNIIRNGEVLMRIEERFSEL